MKDVYVLERDNLKLCVDFGSKDHDDVTVEQIWKLKNGQYYIISSKILGRSFEYTDEKRTEYLINKSESENWI